MLDGLDSKKRRLTKIEEHKGDDEYLQVLYSTDNSFTLSWPALNRSITVDKRTLKAQEHDLFMSKDTHVVNDQVCGFLGILRVYGLDHFVIATERQAVCDMPTYKQPGTNATSATVYALKAVSLIPFFDIPSGRNRPPETIEEETKDGSAAGNARVSGAPQNMELDGDKISEVVEKI